MLWLCNMWEVSLLFFFFPVSECGGFLWPDNPRWRYDHQLTPGIQEVLLCDHGDWLPPDNAGQLSQRQGPVPFPLLPGLQLASSGPPESCACLARVSVPPRFCPSQPQIAVYLWWKLRRSVSCRLLRSVLWWSGHNLASLGASSLWEEPTPTSAVHRKLPDPEAGDQGDSASSWLCGGLHLLQTG